MSQSKPYRRVCLSVSLTILSALVVCSSGQAAITFQYDVQPGPSGWNSGTNGFVGYNVFGTADVTAGDDLFSNNCYVGFNAAAEGHLTIAGNGSTLNHYGALVAGHYGEGTVNINTQAVVYGYYPGAIGNYAGSKGTVNVNGAGSQWNNSSNLQVGDKGEGILNITGGGAVSNNVSYAAADSGSKATITVRDPGSKWTANTFYIAPEGNATINILAGGEIISNGGEFRLGNDPASVAALTVSGAGSKLNVIGNNLLAGYGAGTVTIDIDDGATVSNNVGYLGYGPYGSTIATVDGLGTVWNNAGFYVGLSGDSELDITGGATVISSGGGTIAYEINSSGMVTVDGIGSTWTTQNNLTVGYYGSGGLEITDGGLVSVGGTLTVKRTSYQGDGYINLSTGGMLALAGDADDSIGSFLGLITGNYVQDNIRWWNDSIPAWASIISATKDIDYTLEYQTAGPLTGYTVLTVGTVPEPSTVVLLTTLLLTVGALVRRSSKR